MKKLTGILFALLVVGCSTVDKVRTSKGVLFEPTVGITVFQGADENGVLLGTIQANTGSWFYLPVGFEMLTGAFSNDRGGQDTLSINVTAEHPYFFALGQKPGMITPDVVIRQVSEVPGINVPPPKQGMAQIYVFYNTEFLQQINADHIKQKEALMKRFGCSESEVRLGTCQ